MERMAADLSFWGREKKMMEACFSVNVAVEYCAYNAARNSERRFSRAPLINCNNCQFVLFDK